MTTTCTHVLAWARQHGVAHMDAQMLLLHVLQRSPHERAWLITHSDDAITPEVQLAFERLCERRMSGEPIAYLVGHKEFFGLSLEVDARVLDPRPDTETLVEWALELLQPLQAPEVADLGTGSGAIALALQAHKRDARVLGVDASAQALAVARANAQRLQLSVQWQQADWFRGVAGCFDLVVSNPPYIPEGDPHLPTLRHEPHSALVSGVDGLDDLRRIITQTPTHLKPGGWLLLEHGFDQSESVQSLLRAAGFTQVQGRKDLAGHLRCSGGTFTAV